MSGSRWAEKLRQFNEAHSSKSGGLLSLMGVGSNCLLLFKNYVHDCGISESQQGGDEELLEEYYTQFKGSKDEDKKYSLIPKFYSKVRNLYTALCAVLVLEQNMHKVKPQEYRLLPGCLPGEGWLVGVPHSGMLNIVIVKVGHDFGVERGQQEEIL